MVDVLRLIGLYRKINLLSIDVALGAVACSVFLARAFHTPVSARSFVVLGITVWIIYTIDHLIDGGQSGGDTLSKRHRFHQQHLIPLTIVLAVAAIINAVLVAGLSRPVLLAGVVVLLLVAIYFLVQNLVKGFKELLCGLIYLAGVLIVPLTGYQHNLTLYDGLVTAQLFFVILFNLFMFSWFDEGLDQANGWTSFATYFGKKVTRNLLVTLLIMHIAVYAIDLSVEHFRILPVVLLLMNTILASIFFRPDYFSVLDRYRLLGDAVFLLPVVTIAFR